MADRHYVDKIVESIRVNSQDSTALLEIGPGLGALTSHLLPLNKKMWVVEFDRGLADNLGSWENEKFKVLCQDVLTLPLAPLAQEAGGAIFVCGNLPYNISSPILFWLLNARENVSGAVFMLQREMAQRLVGQVGTKDYGRLTVALSIFFSLEKICDVPPTAFHPQPKVFSSVVYLKPKMPQTPIDPDLLGRFTSLAFAARRKTIMNNLAPHFGKEKTTEALERLKLTPGQRPETITAEQFAQLALFLS